MERTILAIVSLSAGLIISIMIKLTTIDDHVHEALTELDTLKSICYEVREYRK